MTHMFAIKLRLRHVNPGALDLGWTKILTGSASEATGRFSVGHDSEPFETLDEQSKVEMGWLLWLPSFCVAKRFVCGWQAG